MSSLSVLASFPGDHFQCSICQNIFSDLVTTPCGHNFCKACLSDQWDQSEICHCPTCNKRFYGRPEISTNEVIEEISAQIKRRRVESSESADADALWQVKCDVCTEIKFKAYKSCLGCWTSYCEAHLEPHQRLPSLMRHKLIDPVENLEERMCVDHERDLELFCRDDQVCICLLCNETDHKDHETVPVEEEGPRQKEKIGTQMANIKLMIEDRMEKIREFKDASEERREKASKELADSEILFNTLMERVQEAKTNLTSNILEKLRKSREKDNAMIEKLQEEIAKLQRKHAELEELSRSDDHFQLLQSLQTLSTASVSWSKLSVYSDLCVQTVRRAMTHLVQGFLSDLKTLTETELTRMRQYKESVTFDPDTAGSGLVVTEFGKRLKYFKNATFSSSDDCERSDCPMILGKKGFSSGRHYWEVRVGLRTNWDVGVVTQTANRTGKVARREENGFFAIGKSGFDYKVHCTRNSVLHLCPRPREVGVYVDYNEGRVSFYDVDRKMHIHSFTRQSFQEKLFPYFYLSSKAKKSEPLVLTSMESFASYLARMCPLRLPEKKTE